MSSLVSLKKDIADSSEELVREAEILVNYEDTLNIQYIKVHILKDHISRLTRALNIIEGNETITQAEVKSDIREIPAPAPLPVPAPAPRGIPCSACGKGSMRPAVKRVPSGVYVNMMQCDDGACNNETY